MKMIKTKKTPDPMPKVTTNPKIKLKPGQKVQRSGIYRTSNSKQNGTLVKGEPAPPTLMRGETWTLIVDPHPNS